MSGLELLRDPVAGLALGALGVPDHVLISSGGLRGNESGDTNGVPLLGVRGDPLVDFGMAIGEGKTTSAVVIVGRGIDPGVAALELRGEAACIVDAVRMFIGIYPGLGGARIIQAGHFLGVIRVVAAGPGVGVITDTDVTGDGAGALGPATGPLLRADLHVRGAFEDVLGIGEVGGEVGVFGIQQKHRVGVMGAGGPIEPTCDPGTFGNTAAVAGGGEAVLVVAEIHMAGEHELFGIVHAEDAFGLFFGFGKGGQQHACEDRDDGDNHEQLDQSKATAWLHIEGADFHDFDTVDSSFGHRSGFGGT